MNLPKLDIIIPQSYEDEAKIKPLLNSIEDQIYVTRENFAVTIVNDHTDIKLSENFLRSYHYPITYICTPKNGGAGLTRQFGIDHTHGDYIMFIDADDRLASCMAFYILFTSLQQEAAKDNCVNLLETAFYEEMILNNGGYVIIPHDKPNSVWLHGKIFRRAFLQENGIRFHPTLRGFEDTFFCKLVRSLAPLKSQIFCNQFTYFWKRNDQSITSHWNHDGKSYMYWHNDWYITSGFDALKFLKPRWSEINLWDENITNVIMTTYFLLQVPEFSGSDAETRIKVTNMYNMLYKIIKDIMPETYKWDELQRAKLYQKLREDMMNKFRFTSEKITWNDFLALIDKKFPDLEGNAVKLLHF